MDEVVALERRLLDPAVRVSPAEVGRLLHPDFLEIGDSGRVFDRASVVAALALDPGAGTEVGEMVARSVRADVVLVTYTARSGPAVSRRCSLWVCDKEGWRVRFHQGTPARAA